MNKVFSFIKYAVLVFTAVVVGFFALVFFDVKRESEHRLDNDKRECATILAKPMPAWPDCAAEMAPKPEPEGFRGNSGLVGLRSTFGGCGEINDRSERARYDDCKKYGSPRPPVDKEK
jgi:hypothetical protein